MCHFFENRWYHCLLLSSLLWTCLDLLFSRYIECQMCRHTVYGVCGEEGLNTHIKLIKVNTCKTCSKNREVHKHAQKTDSVAILGFYGCVQILSF